MTVNQRGAVDDQLSSVHKEHGHNHTLTSSSSHRRHHGHHNSSNQTHTNRISHNTPESCTEDDGPVGFNDSETRRLILEARSYADHQENSSTTAKSKQQQTQQQQFFLQQQQQQARINQAQQASNQYNYSNSLDAQQNLISIMSRYPNNLQLNALMKYQEIEQQRALYGQGASTSPPVYSKSAIQLSQQQQQLIDAQYHAATSVQLSPYASQRGVYLPNFYPGSNALSDQALLQHLISPNSIQEIFKKSTNQTAQSSGHQSQNLLMPSHLNMSLAAAMNSDPNLIVNNLRSPQHASILTGTASNSHSNARMHSPLHHSNQNSLHPQQQQKHSFKKRILMSQSEPSAKNVHTGVSSSASSNRSSHNKPATYHVDYELLSDTDDS